MTSVHNVTYDLLRGHGVTTTGTVSQSPLKDNAFSTFLDQNPPFELRPENGISPSTKACPAHNGLSSTTGRVEDGRGSLGHSATLRFPSHLVTGGGRPPPVPTERGVRLYRTTLFGSWFTALQAPAASRKGGAV